MDRMLKEFMGEASAPSTIPHAREYMGCEVNLIGANKNAEGEGAGAEKARTKEDAWLGGMPGMKQFSDIFGAQTETSTDASAEATAEAESSTSAETETSTETSTEASTESESKSESSSDQDSTKSAAAASTTDTKPSSTDCKECEKLDEKTTAKI